MIERDAVLDALGGVRDPELDEPLTDLGFVTEVVLSEAAVRVRLRLPTYFCAPNFAYLMVSDARDAVLAVPGVESVDIDLEDHFASREINGAVGQGGDLETAFPGETDGTVGDLRDLFARKALTARQGTLADALLASGMSPEQVVALRVRDLAPGADAARCLEIRAQLGLETGPDAPAFVLPGGGAIDAAGLKRYLRLARLVRVSIEGNAGLCRGLLATRYGLPQPEEAAA